MILRELSNLSSQLCAVAVWVGNGIARHNEAEQTDLLGDPATGSMEPTRIADGEGAVSVRVWPTALVAPEADHDTEQQFPDSPTGAASGLPTSPSLIFVSTPSTRFDASLSDLFSSSPCSQWVNRLTDPEDTSATMATSGQAVSSQEVHFGSSGTTSVCDMSVLSHCAKPLDLLFKSRPTPGSVGLCDPVCIPLFVYLSCML